MKKLFTFITMLVIGISGMWGQVPVIVQDFITSTETTTPPTGWTAGSGKGNQNGVKLNTNGMTNNGSWSQNYAYANVALSKDKKYTIKYETYKNNTNSKDVNCIFYLSSASYSVCIGNSYNSNNIVYVGELTSAAHGQAVSFQNNTGKNPNVLQSYNNVNVAKKLTYTLYLEGTSLTGTVTDGTATDNINVTLTKNDYEFTNIGFVLDGPTNNVGITKLEVYEQRRIISMNFGNQGQAEDNDGLFNLPAAAWNNVTAQSNTRSDLKTWTGKGMQTLASNWSITWSAGAVWKFNNAGEKILKGYLDDNNTNQATVTFTNVPFATGYDVYIYKTSDTGNVGQSPITITSGGIERSYTTSTDGEGFFGTDYWGETQYTTSCLGKNVIVVRGLTASTFTIKGGGRDDNVYRGAIAAIQIVETGINNTVPFTGSTYDASELSAPVYLTKDGDLEITGSADKMLKYVDVGGVTGTVTYNFTDTETSGIKSSAQNNVIYLYSGGAGTSNSPVSINHNGGTATLTGADKTYYLSESYNDKQTTVNMDGTTVNYSDALGIGKAIYNINNTEITTPKFITSQGGNSRSAVVNLTGNSVITVTGNTNLDGNTNSIMIGHWNGSSDLTLSGTAQIVAEDAQFLVGLTRNNQTITLNENSSITAKGIKVSSGASGTNTLNLNGGSLSLGEYGITSYSSTNISVNVNENTTITANAATLPLTQPITVAADKTLTIDGGTNIAEITLPNSLTNNGTIHFKDAILNLTERDFSELSYTFNNCTAQFAETGDEYKVGGFTITNIPSGVTVKVKKYDATTYEAVTIVDGTATFSHDDVGVSGYAAWLDYTFNESTKARNIHTPADNQITNAGNAGSGEDNNLKIDGSYTTATSYNDDGTLKVMSTPYRRIDWPTNYTVAVAGNVPDVENGCLVAFGSTTVGSSNYLAIVRGANQNEIKLVKGHGMNSAFEVISTMSAANATALSHLVVFTKNGNTFTVYLDGVQKTQVTYSDALGGGLQIGSVHGGVSDDSGSTGIVRVGEMDDATAKAKVFAKAIRVYDYVISDDQMSQLTEEFPYTSFGGKYTRTITENSNLSATDAWLNADTQGNVDIPVNAVKDEVTYYPDVEITTDAASTLTVNADMDAENIKFGGTGKLTIASDGTHHINIYGSVTANGPVSIKYGETDLSSVPVSIGESGSVEFDFSGYDFSEVVTPTDFIVTGNTSDYGSKVTARYPESDTYRSFSLAHNGGKNQYVLTVTPAREEAQTVYAPAGTTQVTDGMYVKMTADAETNDGLLIPGDNLVFNSSETIKLKESANFCTFEIQDGATVTVNNKTNSDYALNGETITITNGTLKLNNGNGDAKINSATVNISENGALDNYGWLTVDGILTVNSNYNKTILNNSDYSVNSQIRGTGKIVKGGTGTINMRAMPHCTENEVTTKHPIEISGGTLILSDGAKAGAITGSGTLNVPAATSISVASIATGTTLTGNGNLALTSFPSATAPTLTDWTGSIEFPSPTSGQADLAAIFNAWGNANSTIKLHSVTGWLPGTKDGSTGYTVNPALNILESETLTINNGSSNTQPLLNTITGAGTLEQTWAADAGTYELHISKLTGFTGTLKGTNKPIVVEKLVCAEPPYADALLIKTSGAVSLAKIYVDLVETTAYTWETKTDAVPAGIYVSTFNLVQLYKDMAVVAVSPYYYYIGAGVGKYTVTLGSTPYTNVDELEAAITGWATTSDCFTPVITLNQPTSGFYRFRIGNKYMCSAADNNNVRTATTTNNDASTIFYLDGNNYLIAFSDGYGFNYGYCRAVSPGIFNAFDFSESATKGCYNIHSNAGTGDTQWSDRYITINGSDKLAEGTGTWAIEPATSVPVTFKKAGLGYATLYTPVALQIPENTNAYVCKLQEAPNNAYTLTFYEITAIKDESNHTTIPANTAVLLYRSGVKDSDEDVVVNFPITTCKDEEGEDVVITENSFYGTLATEAFDPNSTEEDIYSLRTYLKEDQAVKVGFYKKTAGTTCAGFKAWIKTDHPVNDEVRNIIISFDGVDNPTGIVEALGLENANVEIYDLNGRKMATYKKGINIVNGKKVLVK